MQATVVLLLASLAVSSQAGGHYYSAPSPVVVRKVAPVVKVLPAPSPVLVPAPAPVVLPASPAVVPVRAASAVVPLAPATTASQFHAQDELGQASFGYSHPGQASVTHRDANGNMFGSWSYINPEGKEVVTSFVADDFGFRVVSNDLPVGPVAAAPAVPVAAAPLPFAAAPLPVAAAPLPIAHAPVAVAAPLAPLAPLALPLGPGPVLDTPEVIEAKRQHFAAHAAANARNGFLIRHRRGAGYERSYHRKGYKSYDTPVFRHELVPAAPVVVKAAPVVIKSAPVAVAQPLHLTSAPLAVAEPLPILPHALPAVEALPAIHAAPAPALLSPVAPTVTKFHSQDELGQAAFGFTTPDQSQSNFRDIHGNQVGHYSYINPEGQEIVVHYTAGHDGFRVLSNALPVAPAAVVLHDTPEVAHAKRQHFALFNDALLRSH